MIQIAQAVHDELVAHALKERPFECCGILAGTTDAVTASYRTANAADLSGIRYAIDPKEILQVSRQIDGADLDMLGVYHSHPFTRAYPSATDIGQAWEGLVYVIVSLADFLAPDLRAFTVVDGEATEVPVEMTP